MTNEINKIAKRFIRKNYLTHVNYNTLCEAAVNEGYTVIEFNALCNDEDVDILITNLHLKDIINKSRGFTYADGNFRLIFINGDLSAKEKELVIAHEIGHIVCKHMTDGTIIGRDVCEEYEANEFTHYILKKRPILVLMMNIMRHKFVSIIALALVIVIITVTSVIAINLNNNNYYGENYVTPTGTKYHRKDCIHIKNASNTHRLSVEEYETGDYSPCGVCLPD